MDKYVTKLSCVYVLLKVQQLKIKQLLDIVKEKKLYNTPKLHILQP